MGELALEVEGVTKAYARSWRAPRVDALRGVTLRVARGEVHGLLGPNGAGKTTLVKVLVGLVRPNAGRVSVLGRDAGDVSSRARLGYLPERYSPDADLTGIAVLEREGALFGLGRAERRALAPKLVERVALERNVAERRVGTYSKGQLARLGLAAALVPDPLLVLLDEPTDGLDPLGRRHVRDLVLELKREGRAVLLNSHLLSEAERCCDHVAILDRGALAAEGTMQELLARGQGSKNEVLVRTAPAPDDALVAALGAASKSARRDGDDGVIVELEAPEKIDAIVDAIRARGVSLRELAPRRASLEDVFIGLVVHPEEAAKP